MYNNDEFLIVWLSRPWRRKVGDKEVWDFFNQVPLRTLIRMNQEKTIVIKQGPAKMDLMLALFEPQRCGKVTFVIETEHIEELFALALGKPTQKTFSVDCSIDGVMPESGGGESWCFQGHILLGVRKESIPIRGYYSTRARSGHFRSGRWMFAK
jgi:hypothetical protein